MQIFVVIEYIAVYLKRRTSNLILKSILICNVGFLFAEYIAQILNGTQIRIASSEETVQSIGMIVGGHFIKSLDPDAPPLKFEVCYIFFITMF